jgi:hypothetical protein
MRERKKEKKICLKHHNKIHIFTCDIAGKKGEEKQRNLFHFHKTMAKKSMRAIKIYFSSRRPESAHQYKKIFSVALTQKIVVCARRNANKQCLLWNKKNIPIFSNQKLEREKIKLSTLSFTMNVSKQLREFIFTLFFLFLFCNDNAHAH